MQPEHKIHWQGLTIPRHNVGSSSTSSSGSNNSSVDFRDQSQPYSEDKAADSENKKHSRDRGRGSTIPFPPAKRAVKRKLPPIKRRIKRHRFSSPFTSDESGTDFESDSSQHKPRRRYNIRRYNTSGLLPSPSSVPPKCPKGKIEETKARIGANGRATQQLVSQGAVVYEQQSWEGQILAEREVQGGRGRPRKQYLICWNDSWMDGARLTGLDLLQDWREKRMQ